LAGFFCCIFSFPLGGPFAREQMVAAFRAVTSGFRGATPSPLRHTSALPPIYAIFPLPPPLSQGRAPPPVPSTGGVSQTGSLRFPLLRFILPGSRRRCRGDCSHGSYFQLKCRAW